MKPEFKLLKTSFTISSQTRRIESLDIFRGFILFWIIGGDRLVKRLTELFGGTFLRTLQFQMDHANWKGIRFYDLIFPSFMLISGAGVILSINGKTKRGVSIPLQTLNAVKRAGLLVAAGIFFNTVICGMYLNIRIASVLGQIGIAYLVVYFISFRGTIAKRVCWLAGIITAYWAALRFIPVPGYGPGTFTQQGSLSAFIDTRLLPGAPLYGSYDPEGILQIISSVTVVLAGTFCADILLSDKLRKWHKALIFPILGLIFLGSGFALSLDIPAIKKLWTPSFDLIASGWAILMFSGFYILFDLIPVGKYEYVFRVIGKNSILIYLLYWPLWFLWRDYPQAYLINQMPDAIALVYSAEGFIGAQWLFLFILFKMKIFLKL